VETLNKNEHKVKQLSNFMDALTNPINQKEKRALYEQYKEVIKDINAIDLFYVDMYKQQSKLTAETIKETANKFVNVFHEGLKRNAFNNRTHPFYETMLDENEAITNHLQAMKAILKSSSIHEAKPKLINAFERLLEVEKKYVRKENILFPRLENVVPSTRPLEVMWTLHDDARTLLKEIIQALKVIENNEKTLSPLIGKYYYLLYGIMQKESLILMPVAEKVLDKDTLDKMYHESIEYGFVFIEPKHQALKQTNNPDDFIDGTFKVANGELDFKALNLMLNHLPVDITYVDKNDQVKYFNQTKTRHFPRNPSIIGRKVEHCHPPKSVNTVIKIVEAFKKGEKDMAEFWINYKEHFLYITYYAIRDAQGAYEGVLEVSQDVTKIRALKGENRLLNWE